MKSTKYNGNRVALSGRIISEPVMNHSMKGNDYYLFTLGIERFSGYMDVIPVMIPSYLKSCIKVCENVCVMVSGRYRSYIYRTDTGNKHLLYVFANDISFPGIYIAHNTVSMDGYLCRPPQFRETPLGRKITDIMLAVNRPSGKSDYIPCICWGEKAREVKNYAVGDHCIVNGRIQSREYIKVYPDMSLGKKIAYEVSLYSIHRNRQCEDIPSLLV